MELKCLARPRVSTYDVRIGSLNVNDVFTMDGMEYTVKGFIEDGQKLCVAVPVKRQNDIYKYVKFLAIDTPVIVSTPVREYLCDLAAGTYFFHDGNLLRLDSHSPHDTKYNCTLIADCGNVDYLIYEYKKTQVTLAEIVLQ